MSEKHGQYTGWAIISWMLNKLRRHMTEGTAMELSYEELTPPPVYNVAHKPV